MIELQKLILDVLDQIGPMTECSLRTACLISPSQRGGFRTSLNFLFKKRLVSSLGPETICISRNGVHAVEAYNIAHPDHCSSVSRPMQNSEAK